MLVGGWFWRSRTRVRQQTFRFESGIDSVGTARRARLPSFTRSHVLRYLRYRQPHLFVLSTSSAKAAGLALWKLHFTSCYWLAWFIWRVQRWTDARVYAKR